MSGPSPTARRVAAYRLGFERLAAPFGDPAADDALGRDVAGETDGTGSEVMARYLRARTAFFDRVVVNAIERGVTQIVNLGAGYDGRSLRYAKPGVHWWEIDRADTQADKLARLGRLNLGAGQVTFVPRDLAEGGLAEALRAAGYEPEAAGLFVCEGVAAYLDDSVLERLLRDTRTLATAGTRLALSVGAAPASDARAERRERIRAAAARLGEPAVGSVTARDAAALLVASRWRPAEISERARQAGFVVAVPLWAPASGAQPRTTSVVGRFIEEMLQRAGTDTLGRHLETTYGVPITGTRELDLGVHAVERSDGSRWMARVFPAARTTAAVRADAAALGWLAAAGFPAERCADPEPVSIHEGQPVLVTEFLPGRKPPASPATFATLGRLLAALHTLDPPWTLRRPGGAWHHLALDAGLAGQKDAAITLFTAARPRVAATDPVGYEALAAALRALDELADLPHAFIHPDPVPVNVITTNAGPVLIDWTGAGWAPRVASLGFLLWAAARSSGACIDAAVAGYRSLIRPEPVELSRLEQAMGACPLVLSCWTLATGRGTSEQGAAWWEDTTRRVTRAARRAREGFARS
jgi:methyltransferase (TIGR00027 family)